MKHHSFILLFCCLVGSSLMMPIYLENFAPAAYCLQKASSLKPDTSNRPKIIIDSFKLEILQPSYGVQFYKEGIIFLGRTNNEEKMLPSHISFGALTTYFGIVEDTTLARHSIFLTRTAFPYASDATTFSTDFKTMYFSMVSKEDGKEKIFRAIYSSNGRKKSGWSIDKNALSFCTKNSNFTYPCLSAEGKIMIFASDMAGAIGGMDLYISWKENEKWSEPRNLGTSINTKGNEMFPFLDLDNNLFFSSNGLPGQGGYDLFICKHNDKGWEQPVNLTKVINSKQDEMAFKINKKDQMSGFLTKRKNSNSRDIQLFKISLQGGNKLNPANKLSNVLYSLGTDGNDTSKINVLAVSQYPQIIQSEVIKTPQIIKLDTAKKTDKVVIPIKLKKDSVILSNVQIKSDTIKKFKAFKVISKDTTIKAKPIEKTNEVPIIKNAVSNGKDDGKGIIFRVQILSSMSSKGKLKISVEKETYDAYEYLYAGEFRIAIGEFSKVADAVHLQNLCRKAGYPQAFVIALRKNERILDPSVFK